MMDHGAPAGIMIGTGLCAVAAVAAVIFTRAAMKPAK
jgi:hypothetical protein